MYMRPTKYPAINEITMVIPIKITDFGIYVQLVEYNDIEGLIILSELCRGRIRSINKIVSIGKKKKNLQQMFNQLMKYQVILHYLKKLLLIMKQKYVKTIIKM